MGNDGLILELTLALYFASANESSAKVQCQLSIKFSSAVLTVYQAITGFIYSRATLALLLLERAHQLPVCASSGTSPLCLEARSTHQRVC